MVEERIATQAGHGWNLLTVSTPRVRMTGAAPGHIDGGLGQAGPRLRLVPELAGADGPGSAPSRHWQGPDALPGASAFLGHLGQEKKQSGELTGEASSFLN